MYQQHPIILVSVFPQSYWVFLFIISTQVSWIEGAFGNDFDNTNTAHCFLNIWNLLSIIIQYLL